MTKKNNDKNCLLSMEEKYCPKCGEVVNANSNRLITENCGHVKCRKCFLIETSGCFLCIKNDTIQHLDVSPERSSDDDGLCIDTDDEDNTIESFDVNKQETQPDKLLESNLLQKNCHEDLLKLSPEKIIILEDLRIPTKSGADVDAALLKKKPTLPSHILRIVDNGQVLYKCSVCNKIFKSRNQQYYHIYCANPEKKPFKCTTCCKAFASSSHLKYHIKVHTDDRKYICPECSKCFARRISLQRHLKHHRNSFKYNCEKCYMRFNEKISYDAHMNKHANIFPYECATCGKKFSFKSNLIQHRVTHTDEKKFTCTICDKSFGRKNAYNEHLIRHTRSKAFPCTVCRKNFIDRKTLDRHMLIHDGSLSYICPFCSVRSCRRDNLARHIRNMHPNEDIDEALEKIKYRNRNNILSSESKNNDPLNPNKEHDIIDSTKISSPQDSKECHLPNTDVYDSQKITITSSVIRSIGNAKPVIIPINQEQQQTNMENNSLRNVDSINKQVEPQETNTRVINKKLKKKYDPCEIYRKILFASNDDDSMLDNEGINSDSKDTHAECCNNVENSDTIEKLDVGGQVNFTEMHWRKRTSQYFFAAL